MYQVQPIIGMQQPTTPTTLPSFRNQLREACIRVPKVYDWLLATRWERFKIPLSVHCRHLLQEALDAGQEIYVQCLDPFSPTRSKDRSCCALPSPHKTKINVRGNMVPVGIVSTLFQTNVTLFFFADCRLLFDFSPTIQMEHEIVVCLPEPLDEKNILCRIATGECLPFTGFLANGMIELELFLCQEIIVEAHVQLELMAKNGTPRLHPFPVRPRIPRLRLDSIQEKGLHPR
ncbi:MAG: hypothetical protein K0R47_2724 [Brevibacillus sp.]|nr:hypothetical protein [Brevibacillus sp.]